MGKIWYFAIPCKMKFKYTIEFQDFDVMCLCLNLALKFVKKIPAHYIYKLQMTNEPEHITDQLSIADKLIIFFICIIVSWLEASAQRI